MKILTVKANETFDQVFGADSFIQQWPNITTKGVMVTEQHDGYFILKVKAGKLTIASDTAFFSKEEIDNHMTILDEMSV